jgi:hypothetical protein
MNAIWLLNEWDKVLQSDDPRDATRFLWHYSQDFITVIKQQKFVIEMLDDIIADKDAEIEELQELITLDQER